ncbi:MAG: hypothetical protein A2Z96_04005 [Spirochaetes bacterium GWB1_48_6]|nr:MAG: hypothetical protein A2Z96_04005 [Spirochaetes bacterium GWB1_48_6]
MANVAILWDIENVTPPSNNTLFIDALWDHAESLGRVVIARAYCDWTQPGFSKLALGLKKYHYYLVHVPSERKKKNSVDIQVVSDTMEIMRFYDYIDTYLLVTGDSDFRPLIVALRRAGKMNHVVCDIKTASQDLLALADSFTDYRDLLTTEEDDEDDIPVTKNFPKEYWYSALAETVSILMKEKKSTNVSSVKLRMKILNPNFDEKVLGFRRWGDFVGSAVRHGVVRLEEDEKQTILTTNTQKPQEKGILQNALRSLIDVLSEMDGSKEAQFHDYSLVSSKLKDKKLDLRSVGFSQFKKFIQAAEMRGLVESQTDGMEHSVRRSTGS